MIVNQRVIIPPFTASYKVTKTLRYVCTAATSGSITAQNLAAILTVATSATTGFSVVGAILLHSAEIWSESAPGAQVLLEISQETTTFIGSPSVLRQDISTGLYPAYVKIKPPKNSLSGFWISGNATSTGTVLTVNASGNSVLDLKVTLVFLDQSVVGQATTGSGMTAGVMYQKNLIGGNFTPAGFPGY